MDTLMNSQIFTQVANANSSQNKASKREQFIDNIIKMGKLNSNDVPISTKNTIRKNFEMLTDSEKRNSMKSVLIRICSIDQGSKLVAFTDVWFRLACELFTEEEKKIDIIIVMMKICLDAAMSSNLSSTNFFGIFNYFNNQLVKMPINYVMQLISHITDQISVFRLNEKMDENGVQLNPDGWKNFIQTVIKRISSHIENIENDEMEINQAEAPENILFNWLKIASDAEIFKIIVDIGCNFASKSLERFCDEIVLQEIETDINVKEDSIELKRSQLTWKSIVLIRKLDKERSTRLLNAAVNAWSLVEVDNDEGEEVRSEDILSEPLLKCILVSYEVLSDDIETAKKFLNLAKNDKYRVWSSDFGFGLSVLFCCNKRVDSLNEMKKYLQKLWKYAQEEDECTWVSDLIASKLLRIIQLKLISISKSIEHYDEARNAFTKPMFVLLLSLMDSTSHSNEVVIVDGRVIDASNLWMTSKRLLSKICCAQVGMEEQLSSLFQAIVSTSNNNSALVLIDVLRDLVKKCSIEILNNYKLIGNLFDYVCRMRRDIAVSLMRCLLPIINTRSQLRNILFRSLKKDLLKKSTAESAVPIVLMLLKSVSKRRECGGGGGQFDHSNSQSFGSFSTQSLASMGCRKNVDEGVGLELIGIIRKSLGQPVMTKIALYDGICELATTTTTMMSQFLDLLISHSKSVGEWNRHSLITSTSNYTHLIEPLPHLIQTVECLMGVLSAYNADDQDESHVLLLKKAVGQMDNWLKMATRSDLTDFEIDKNIEWRETSKEGRSNILFTRMMINVYDVLIEHMWRRVEATEKKEDYDILVGLLRRRREMNTVLNDKVSTQKTNRKDQSGGEKMIDFDANQGLIITGAKTLSAIMCRLMMNDETNESGNNTTFNVRDDILMDVREELLRWVLMRSKVLSEAIAKEFKPMHSILCGTDSLLSLSIQLLKFFLDNDTPSWVEATSSMKTMVIETYANIVKFLSIKYKKNPLRIISKWNESGETQNNSIGADKFILRQAHFLAYRVIKSVNNFEDGEDNENKQDRLQYELQIKALLKASIALLRMSSNIKVWPILTKKTIKLLEVEEFHNNSSLREYCKFIKTCTMCSGDNVSEIIGEIKMILENILEFLSDENDEIRYKFITKKTINIAIEFVLSFIEHSINLIRDGILFMKDYSVKPPILDEMMTTVLSKYEEVTEMVTRSLQIFIQYKLMQERITEIMTNYFATLNLAVALLLSNTKAFSPQMQEWDCVNKLATIIKLKLEPIIAMVDEFIGFTKENDEMSRKLSHKTRYNKSKRDEKLYSKFSHERESVQNNILMLCKYLKDERLDLQIRNNSIGYRDFRINIDILRNKLSQDDFAETSKRRRVEDDGELSRMETEEVSGNDDSSNRMETVDGQEEARGTTTVDGIDNAYEEEEQSRPPSQIF